MRRLRWALGALAIVSGLQACGRAESGPPGGMPPAQVSVVKVEARSLPVSFEYVGQTAGSREVEIRARVPGILQRRNYREGGYVAAGQSLFTIDPAPYRTAVARAEADLAAAKARALQAERNAARLQPLFEAKAVSQKDFDEAVAARAISQADIQSAQARLDEAKLNLGYARVESPIAGIAGRAQRSEGNYVTGPDVLLTTVSQLDPIFVLFGIPDEARQRLDREVAAGRLRLPKNNAFEVSLKLAEGASYGPRGKMNFSDVRISGQTGTSEARAVVPNPKGELRPGQFVRVVLSGAQRVDAILIPQRAVIEGPQGKSVYVVGKNSTAEARAITVGDWQGDQWVVQSGLAPGEQVIIDGLMKLGPGAPVQVTAGKGAPAPAAK